MVPKHNHHYCGSSSNNNNRDRTTQYHHHQKKPKPPMSINDHADLLVEILKRLDGRSLCVAACVCRLWCAVARNDAVWEYLCFRYVASPPPSEVRPVVRALGGYRRLYMACVRPQLSRLGLRPARRTSRRGELSTWRAWSRDELQLWLSLFCVDCYEKLGSRFGDAATSSSSSSSSLMFLCKPVNVLI